MTTNHWLVLLLACQAFFLLLTAAQWVSVKRRSKKAREQGRNRTLNALETTAEKLSGRARVLGALLALCSIVFGVIYHYFLR